MIAIEGRDATERFLLDLLRLEGDPSGAVGVREAFAREGGEIPTGALRSLLVAHGIAPWCRATMESLGLADVVPGLGESLRRDLRAAALSGHRILEAFGRVVPALAGGGVPVIALKGVAIAGELYGRPGLRPMGDVDLLVRKGDVDRTLAILASLGYAVPAHVAGGAMRRHHFHLPLVAEGITVEIHWGIADDRRMSADLTRGIWERSVPFGGAGCRRLDPATELVFLAHHLARHAPFNGVASRRPGLRRLVLDPASGNRLIWLLDLHRIMSRGGEDLRAAAAQRAGETMMEEELAQGATLAQALFGGVPGRELPLPAEPRGVRWRIVARAAETLAAGGSGDGRRIGGLMRMDPFIHVRPIRVLGLLDRVAPREAEVRSWRSTHGRAAVPFLVAGRVIAGGIGAIADAAGLAAGRLAVTLRRRVRRRGEGASGGS